MRNATWSNWAMLFGMALAFVGGVVVTALHFQPREQPDQQTKSEPKVELLPAQPTPAQLTLQLPPPEPTQPVMPEPQQPPDIPMPQERVLSSEALTAKIED